MQINKQKYVTNILKSYKPVIYRYFQTILVWSYLNCYV